MNNRYIAIILAAVATTAAAAGGIEDVLGSIERNNSAIKAATASLHADSIAISASNNLEDPTVDFEYNFGKIGDKWAIGVSQGFDWPGAYSARGRANRDRIKALGSAMLTQRLEVLYNAKNLCLNVVYTNRQIEAQRLILNNVNELYDKYSKAFEHGEASIIDLNKLKIERIAARQALGELEVKLATLKAELKGLNNNSDFATVSLEALTAYPADDLAPIDEYEQAFAAFDPQNAYFMYSGEAIKSDVRASKMDCFPKFDLGYKYTNELGDGFNGITVGASIPLFSNRRKVAAAKARAATNELSRASYSDENTARIKSQYAEAVSLRAQLTQYGDVIGDESNFTMLRKSLDGGQMSLLDYLMELRYFLEAKSKYLEIEHSYHATIASLSRYSLLR